MEETALKHLQKIFSNTSNDIMSLPEIYTAVGLDLSKAIQNRNWIGNRLVAFKKYQFAEPIYARKDNTQILESIRLTEKGKNSIKKFKQKSEEDPMNKLEPIAQIEKVAKLIAAVRKENPGAQVTYSLKDEVISVQQVRE